MIKFLKHREIDKSEWDFRLEESLNPKIYAYSWYLDVVSPEWCALVEDRYKSIFPIPVHKRLGVSYISQPLFTQQLGLFSSDETVRVDDFIKRIPKKLWLRSLQIHNKIINSDHKDNYELDISKDINLIRKNYSDNLKRNIKKAYKFKLEVMECSSSILIEMFMQNKGKEVKDLNEKAYNILAKLFNEITTRRMGECYGVYKDGKIISAAFFVNCLGRSTYLFSASNSYAKEVGANHFLIDYYIEKLRKESLILDFEGSMIPSIARFYSSYGARKKYYYLVGR
tara:strand:- start:27355 stop:28203 length:849 start_codon:yes stop_codon:yes gene_type:complete